MNYSKSCLFLCFYIINPLVRDAFFQELDDDSDSKRASFQLLYSELNPKSEFNTIIPLKAGIPPKKILKPKSKSYMSINDEIRKKLIDEVIYKQKKIKHVAEKFNVNYSSAKSICQTFKKEGRTQKKLSKIKKKLGKRRMQVQVDELFGLEIINKNNELYKGQIEIIQSFGKQIFRLIPKKTQQQPLNNNNQNQLIVKTQDIKDTTTKLSQDYLQKYKEFFFYLVKHHINPTTQIKQEFEAYLQVNPIKAKFNDLVNSNNLFLTEIIKIKEEQ